jgi:hypothetical protein
MESWTINAGLGLILGQSTFGASLGWYDTNYGVIKRPGLNGEEGEEEEGGEEEERRNRHASASSSSAPISRATSTLAKARSNG